MLASLLLLSAWASAAAPASKEADLSFLSGRMEALEAEFKALCDGFEPALAELKAIRRSFPADPRPEALIQRASAVDERYRAFRETAQALHSQHGHMKEALRILLLSSDIGSAKSGRPLSAETRRRVLLRSQAHGEMVSRRERLKDGYRDESEAFGVLRRAYEVRAAHRRRLILLAAALSLGLAVVGFGFWLADGTPPPAQEPPAAPLVVAGNFRVIGPLGRGSMGEVYEAIDETLGRRVALKRLREELLQDPAELERLLNEARVMAALKHPNMVAIYGVERDAGQVYLALEFVDGPTLERRLEAEGRLPWPEALRILAAAGAAVDYAHGRKVIHRDLKPANIMFTSKGEVKVMDFGLAYQAAKSVSRLTRAPSWGTPPYMAPEQELGGVSRAVDVYALAVCLYEMLTGELPFKGPNFLAQKRESLWVPPSRLASGLPEGADGLFAIALAPEPSRRFPSAGGLAAACAAL